VLRLLTRPRYVALAVVAVLLAAACVRLGVWQWHRHEERQARNTAIQTSEQRPAQPLGEVLTGGRTPPEWSRVTAIGRYDLSGQVLLRYRPVEGQRGFHVLVPLVTADGRGLVVDRGFLVTTAAAEAAAVPEPPRGTVEVVGRIRYGERGLGREAESDTIRRVDLEGLDRDLSYPLYPVWVQLESEEPPPTETLQPYGPPSTGLGFHLAYAVQWWIFAAMVPVGFVLLVRNEARREDTRRGDVGQRARTG
jgi:cytochrome oxidase assembly protein ShyY1